MIGYVSLQNIFIVNYSRLQQLLEATICFGWEFKYMLGNNHLEDEAAPPELNGEPSLDLCSMFVTVASSVMFYSIIVIQVKQIIKQLRFNPQ